MRTSTHVSHRSNHFRLLPGDHVRYQRADITSPDSPNTLNGGFPQQATQDQGRGFFTAPSRETSGRLVRGLSSTFDDHWSQPRLFYNSLTSIEQQFLINAIRFETSHLVSETVKNNVLTQLNRISNDIAVRVASALGLEAPQPDPTYYHDNTTAGISITNGTLPTIATLKVGILASIGNANGTASLNQAAGLKERFAADGLIPSVIAETLADGVDKTYSAADATDFDAVVVTSGAADAGLFSLTSVSTQYPPARPLQIANLAYLYGKPVAFFGADSAGNVLSDAGYKAGEEGVYVSAATDDIVKGIEDGLTVFKFTARFPQDTTN